MNNVIKKVNIFMILLSLIGFAIMPSVVHASTDPVTLGDLEDLLNELKRQQRENDANQKYTQQQIEARNQAIKNAEAEKVAAEAEQLLAHQKVEESNRKIEQLKKEANEVLLYLQQMQGQNAYVEYVTGATSMTDLVTRIAAIEQISNHIQTTMDNLEIEISKNEKLKIELEEKQKRLDIELDNYRKSIETFSAQLDEYSKNAPGIAEQVAIAQRSYNESKEQCSNNSKTANLGRNAKLSDCSDTPYNAGWLKPLNKGVITSRISIRNNPATGEVGEYHNGLDIGGNPEGTPVYAAAAGTVRAIIPRYRCGGNMVYITATVGGQQYTTYYYHLLTYNVRVGQTVTQNTIIGTVGGYSTSINHGGYDKCTTGAHLHFGVQTGYIYSGTVNNSKVIVPPGFPNYEGYRFSSRSAYWAP